MHAPWLPNDETLAHVDELISRYRRVATECLEPLVLAYYPALIDSPNSEYRKMLELTAKMAVVGHACTEIAGYRYDSRCQHIASLFGGCCFLADSFIDDFGDQATEEYIERFELLLTKGWFSVRNEREKLFYLIISRLFAQRDVFNPTLRQAIMLLFQAQKTDVELRLNANQLNQQTTRKKLQTLKECARNRSGTAIIVLSGFLVPDLPLQCIHMLFTAGALIMHIDDHGDCYSDLYYNRLTYMNQVKNSDRTLKHIFETHIQRLYNGLPQSNGRDLLIGFLYRYYRTRIVKHKLQKGKQEYAWAVYE